MKKLTIIACLLLSINQNMASNNKLDQADKKCLGNSKNFHGVLLVFFAWH